MHCRYRMVFYSVILHKWITDFFCFYFFSSKTLNSNTHQFKVVEAGKINAKLGWVLCLFSCVCVCVCVTRGEKNAEMQIGLWIEIFFFCYQFYGNEKKTKNKTKKLADHIKIRKKLVILPLVELKHQNSILNSNGESEKKFTNFESQNWIVSDINIQWN